MKIALGINTFNTKENRFLLANSSYAKLQQNFDVDIYDIQLPGKRGIFKTLDTLPRVSKDVIPNTNKDLPFVNDLFKEMCSLDYDYFIVSNADVMISHRLIDHIRSNDITALPCSRLDVQPVKNINSNMVPVRWEIGGFDTFVFKTTWYRQYIALFEDFIIGRPWYDHHYAGIMKIFGNNDIIGNKNPAFCLHEHHGFAACAPGNPEYDFNTKQFNNSSLATTYRVAWDTYFETILKPGRQPFMSFLNEVPHEAQIEKQFFDKQIKELEQQISNEKKKNNII